MKKRMKGLISWWLVFAMLFSSVSVSFAAESAEAQKTTAEYYIGSNSLDSSYTVEYGETTDLSLYYGDGAATLTDQVSNLEEENRPENKILLGWKLWGVHYYGDLDAGPIEKSLTDVVTAEDVTTCLNNSDNYYNPLIEPHYVDKYIIDPQPTNETFTVGGKEYNIDDGAYYETTDVTYQWHLWETVPYTVVSAVTDESTEIAKSYTWKLNYSDGKWTTVANSSYSQISVAAQAGDIIDIKFDSDFSGTVTPYYSSGDYEYNSETQSYRYTMSKDGDAYAYIWPEDISVQLTFTASVLRKGIGENIVGETDVTLTDKSEGNEYVCKLTFAPDEDNVILISNPVAYTAPPHKHPICGAEHTDIGDHTGNCEDITWTAWDGTTSFPGGNVYLSNDITLEETLEISSGTVNLCLNGNDILSDNTAIKVTEGAILNICDCSSDKTGTIKSGYHGIYNGGGAVNIYGGKVSGTSDSAVYISGGTLNLKGGRLESISAESNATALYITSSASVEISGGEIYAEGGSDGAVCGVLIADSNSSTTISGGTISAGCTNTASSSRYYTVAAVKHLSGNLSVIGGTLTTDTADNCSAGYVAALYDNRQSNDETSTITISGGTFELKKSKGSQIIGAIITDWSEMPINLSGDLVITAESAPDFAIDPSTPLSFTSKGLNEPEEPYTVAKQNRSSADYPWKFTTGWSQTGISDTDIGKYFVAYGDNYRVTKADNGELQLSETYTISFDAYPATSPDSQKLLYGEKVTKPTTPVREGYGLSHWCTDSSCTNGTTCENAWDFDTDTVTKGDTLYAVWESTHWRVTLRAQGGECDDDYSYVDKITGKLESLPTATRVGYTFNGWFDASEGGNKITTETEFTGDTRIYAQWTAYEITQQPTVDNEYEVKVNPSANVAYTWHEMTETAVTAENAGIYEDEGYSSSYTAGWWSYHSTEGTGTPGYFSIDLNAGDVVEVELSHACSATVRIYHYYYDGTVTRYQDYEDIESGSKATLVAPADAKYDLFVSVYDGVQPTVKAKVIKAGKAIDGQTTSKLTDGVDSTKYVAKITYPDGAVLTSDAVCYVFPSFEVIFNANGGSAVDSQTVENGGTIIEPTAPTKTGYTFAGWYKDSELATAWEFDTDTVTEPTTLYAKWTANTNTPYVVNHWVQTLDAAINGNAEKNETNYTLKEDENLTGTTDATFKANTKEIDGFKAPDKENITIAADGSTVHNYYYAREKYSVSINATVDNGIDEKNGDGQYYYGQEVTISVTLLPGYKWVKWDGDVESTEQTYTFTMWDSGGVTTTPVIDKKTDVVIDETSQFADYNKAAHSFNVISEDNLTGFTVSYEQNDVPVTPINAGFYDVVISRAEDADYKAYSKKLTNGLIINKVIIDEPVIGDKPYNGLAQTADISETDIYTVTKNEGGTNVGPYDVVLTLKDDENYKWRLEANSGATATRTFYITFVENSWNEMPEIAGWTYGDEANEPEYDAKFGTVTVEYKNASEEDLSYTTDVPANAGAYKVKFTVEATANFGSLSKIVDLTIAKAQPSYTTPSNVTATYGETLTDAELPEGWAWKDSTLSVGNAGTHEFTAVFTPQDTTNFEVVEINVSVAVGKTIPSYDIPVDIEATYGDTLADVTLPDGWSWKDSSLSVGNAGTQTFVAVFTPSDTNNYSTVEENITITVAKKEVAEPVASGSYTYTGNEQTVTLTGVESFMTVSGNKATNAGNYVVTVTLDDNHKWNASSDGEIEWSIAKTAPSLEAPTAQNDITYGVLLSTVGLTEGWTWLDGTTIPTVQNSGFAAYFTPADTVNYDWTGIDGWNEVESRVEKTVSVTVTKADSSIAAAPTAILNLEYDGSAKALVNAGTANGGTMQYSLDGTTWSTDIPTRTDAGVYTVHYKVTGDANHNDNEGGTVQVTIAKAAPSLNAPEAITNLIYNGTTQPLTTNGTVSGGEIQFSTSENGTYAPAIITGENAGNYEVWYKIIGDNNHTDIAPVKLDISIAQKSVEGATVGTFVAMTYTENAQTPAATVTIDGLTATGTWSAVTNVNDKTTFTANGNFTGTIAEQSTGMAKATPTVTAPVAKNNLVYNTSALVLTDAGLTTGGTMQYSLDNISWSNDIPSGTNAGDYNVYYKVVGNDNYNGVEAQSIAVSIANANMSADITAVGYNAVFDNQAHTISVAIPDGASIKYGTDDGTYELVAAPQYTNVGTYKVYYKVEKANYNAVTGSADVVITAKDISNAEITLGEALTYTDSEQTRNFTVAPLDGLEIDYTVSGNTGTDAGDYELTINGQGNFTGSKSASWSIAKATQSAPETPVAVNETIKAKADGMITAVTSDMEYKLEGASEYIAISETEIVNLAAGTYLVRYKENANHLAGADKQLVIADGAMITVSFNSNEGTAVDSITCEYNQAITAPAEPTKENFVFAGWYKDAECLDLWNFGNALTEDITLYAKWNDKPVYSVSGKVTDGESGLGGITVTLKQGNTIIATTTTAADGSYSFITEDGLYNIVAEKEENDNSTIKTVKIEVTESANVNDVVFVATDINSELEIKPDTPQIIVGGLDEEAQTVSSSNGNVNVTVKMTVESTEDITGSDDATGQEQRQNEQKEIKKVSGNRYIQFIEINLTQSISGAESTKLEETSGLIEIIIPFEKGNKRNITVYRYHGSVAEKLGAGIGNANADGEYFEVKENHIVVYAKKFSTYAIGYDLPSSGSGGSSVTRYTVKFDTNGGSTVSSATVTKNAKVAEPKAPEKDGYTFGGWYTDEALTEKYDFDSKVTKNFTLYAKWDKHDDEQSSRDTHNCPSLAFDDLDITKWYHFDTDYVIENEIFKGTTETTFEPDSAQTRAMMVTVLYRIEGEPAVNRSIPFADVDMGAYYANAVIWGQQNGIIKGYSETEFGPDDKITREQIAAIMHRYAQYKGIDVSIGENTNILSYDDFDSISEYAIPSMQWAVGSGLIKGKSESTLNPLDNATRVEIAAILHRFIEVNK